MWCRIIINTYTSNFNPPDINDENDGDDSAADTAPTQYSAEVLTSSALSVIERALWDARPNARYQLAAANSKFQMKWPCARSLRLIPGADRRRVQKV